MTPTTRNTSSAKTFGGSAMVKRPVRRGEQKVGQHTGDEGGDRSRQYTTDQRGGLHTEQEDQQHGRQVEHVANGNISAGQHHRHGDGRDPRPAGAAAGRSGTSTAGPARRAGG